MLYIAQKGTLRYPAGSTTVLEAIVRYAISMGIQTQLLKCVAKNDKWKTIYDYMAR